MSAHFLINNKQIIFSMNYTLLIRPPQILHRPIKMIAPRNSVITIINQFYLILETASHYNYCIVSYFYSRWKKIKVNDIEQLLLRQVFPLFIYFYSGSNRFHIVLKILYVFTNKNTLFWVSLLKQAFLKKF